MNPLPLGYENGALVHSVTQILAFQEWKLEFIKMFNDKPLLISVDRSLLSYCTDRQCEMKIPGLLPCSLGYYKIKCPTYMSKFQWESKSSLEFAFHCVDIYEFMNLRDYLNSTVQNTSGRSTIRAAICHLHLAVKIF